MKKNYFHSNAPVERAAESRTERVYAAAAIFIQIRAGNRYFHSF